MHSTARTALRRFFQDPSVQEEIAANVIFIHFSMILSFRLFAVKTTALPPYSFKIGQHSNQMGCSQVTVVVIHYSCVIRVGVASYMYI